MRHRLVLSSSKISCHVKPNSTRTFFHFFYSLSPSIKLDELPQPVEIGFNKECWENSVRGRDPSSLSIKVSGRESRWKRKKNREREREREARARRSITANRIEMQTIGICESPHLYRHRGMSHRYRWPGIHERRKNAKVSDHCDRNKFARRVRQLVRARSCTISSAAAISRQVFLWFAVGSCAGERRAELEQSSLMVINAATRSM